MLSLPFLFSPAKISGSSFLIINFTNFSLMAEHMLIIIKLIIIDFYDFNFTILNFKIDYNLFIHDYRINYIHFNINYVDINYLIKQQFTFIKFIINPYIRAVSIFRLLASHNLSFRQYLKQLINNEINYFSDVDKYHIRQQYIHEEEKIITKYIKIDKNETFLIKLSNGTLFNLDVNKYSSIHHGIKTDNTTFCGDINKDIINQFLPKSYKYFYDDEIKKMVDIYYKEDIEHYGYSFDDFL
jgi:hypothetical protein